MKQFIALLLCSLLLTGCSFVLLPGASESETAAPTTTAAPETTAAPTAEAPTETTVPPGYHHTALAGTWKCTGTEVEGDTNGGGDRTIVITAVGDGTYLITYTDPNFPDYSFTDKPLRILEEPLYEGCGNDRWMGTVDYTSPRNETYTVTIRDDATLIKRNSYTFDGMPMVSHEFFERIP